MKMNKNNIALIVAAICLVGASISAKYIDMSNKSLATDEAVTGVSDPREFVAVTNGTYENGKLKVKIETNAPNGSVFEVYAAHPEMQKPEMTSVTVNRGVAEAEMAIPEGLSTNYVQAYAILDMDKQDGKNDLATVRYGQDGKKMRGNMVFSTTGTNIVGVSETGYVSYPTEEAVKVVLKDEFEQFINSLTTGYDVLFDSIQPSSKGTWDEVNVIFTDNALASGWDTFEKEKKQWLFDLFDSSIHGYKMVDEDTQVKIYFKDTKGNILDEN
ncbi:MAG TPA: hypothetical protein DIC60_04480 [Lachnospiraceae bacterium]|jgi:hypothetical protein|nr:hypothetical protein [Lachnospiraceae bacterium]